MKSWTEISDVLIVLDLLPLWLPLLGTAVASGYLTSKSALALNAD